jgi:parallel beta-helix repeat protein
VFVENSSANVISNNLLTDSGFEVVILSDSHDNQICRNTITYNYEAETLLIYSSNSNRIHHNNFINNPDAMVLEESYNNTWDDGEEGNYWDSYYGVDDGSDGRIAGDGVGDTLIPWNEVDDYPLINPVDPILLMVDNVVYGYSLHSNSTTPVPWFTQQNKAIEFEITRRSGISGYFNITIPKNLIRGEPWTVLLNSDIEATAQAIISTNTTHASIYLDYDETIYHVRIIGTWVVPEFAPQNLAIALLMLTFILILLKRRITSSPAQEPTNGFQQKP